MSWDGKAIVTLFSWILLMAVFTYSFNASNISTVANVNVVNEGQIEDDWWRDFVNIAHRFPIEYYSEGVATFVDEFKIEIIDSSVQTWIGYPSIAMRQADRHYVSKVHSADCYVGALSGFDVADDFPELYKTLPEEEKWQYPNGTIASDPYAVGACLTFSGEMAPGIDQPALSHHNPGWLKFVKDWVNDLIFIGMDSVHLDTPDMTFSLTRGGFGGNDTWEGFAFNQYLRDKFSNSELQQMGIQKINEFNFTHYLASHFEIEMIDDDYRIIDNYQTCYTTVHFSNVSKVMEDPIVKEWIVFQYKSFLQFVKDIQESAEDYASSLNRTILLHTNQYEDFSINDPSGAFEIMLGQFFDVVNMEFNTFFLPPYVRNTLIYKVGQASGGFQKPVWVYEWFGWFSCPYEGGRLIDDVSTILKIKCAEGFASGGIWKIPFATGDPADDWPPRRLIEGNERHEMSKYSQFTYRNKGHLQGAIPTSKVAIIYSIPTMLWDSVPAFGLYPNENKAELAGWAAVLQENHLEYDVHIFGYPSLFDDTFVDKIRNYDLLILPDVVCLSDSHFNVLSNYLETGGHMVMTGQFGVRDENNNLHNESLIELFSRHENVSYIPDLLGYTYTRGLEEHYFDLPSYQTVTDTIMEHLQGKSYLETNASRKIGVSRFTQSNNSQIVIHLVNYDYHYNQSCDWVTDANNIYIKLPLPQDFKLDAVKVFSPDFAGETMLDFNRTEEFVEFTVPTLKVWDIISLEQLHDINNDGTINILDIAIVAKAYNTKPGDENWNPIADIAEPYGEINILDIATVAKDYGKTV